MIGLVSEIRLPRGKLLRAGFSFRFQSRKRKAMNIKCRLLSDAATRTSILLRQQYDIRRGSARLWVAWSITWVFRPCLHPFFYVLHHHQHRRYCHCSLEDSKVTYLWKLSKRKLHLFQRKFHFLPSIKKYFKGYIEKLAVAGSLTFLCFFCYGII